MKINTNLEDSDDFRISRSQFVSTEFEDDLILIKGNIFSSVQIDCINKIFEAATKCLSIPSCNIYLVNIYSMKKKYKGNRQDMVAKSIKMFIEYQGVFEKDECIFIPYYVLDARSKHFIELISDLKRAGFESVGRIYIYTGNEECKKVFETLKEMNK